MCFRSRFAFCFQPFRQSWTITCYLDTNHKQYGHFCNKGRLDYQPLFGKMSPHSSPRRSGWTRAISFVGFSQSCYRLQIFVWQGLSHKLSDQNKVVKMADDVDKMNLAFERVLECFKLQNLKDSQREALQNLSSGRIKTGPGRRRKSSLQQRRSL